VVAKKRAPVLTWKVCAQTPGTPAREAAWFPAILPTPHGTTEAKAVFRHDFARPPFGTISAAGHRS